MVRDRLLATGIIGFAASMLGCVMPGLVALHYALLPAMAAFPVTVYRGPLDARASLTCLFCRTAVSGTDRTAPPAVSLSCGRPARAHRRSRTRCRRSGIAGIRIGGSRRSFGLMDLASAS
jgi:hypothetical protein